MKKIINTTFETSLRILCILFQNNTKESFSLDKIIFLDFIYNYSHSFGCNDLNIHGENIFKFSEIATRRILIQEALKQLVLDNYIIPIFTPAGTKYSILENGRIFINKLNDDYFYEYMNLISNNIKFLELSETELKTIFYNKSKGEM